MTWKIIKLSLKGIYNNKMRSFLTMLGIIIGVMAVVILVSITQGATSGITDSISSMGSQQITATMWKALLPILPSAAWPQLFPQTKP